MKIFRNRTVIGVLCILLALIICFGVTPLFSRSASEKTEIVRVTMDIKEGDEITAEMVQTVEVGAYNLPQNLMTDKKEVVGKYATADLAAGDYAAATLDFSAVIFRYFNPVGAHPSGLIGEAPNGTPNNLMPYITQVAMGKRKQLSVFGADYDTPDGTCIRDYIHIMDIAAGHTAALPFCTSHHGVEVINLGTGMGHSVLELISAFESATGVHIPFQIVGRRAGDIPVCFASAEKAKALLGWQATRTLSDMCRDAWNWQQKNPDGFM